MQLCIWYMIWKKQIKKRNSWGLDTSHRKEQWCDAEWWPGQLKPKNWCSVRPCSAACIANATSAQRLGWAPTIATFHLLSLWSPWGSSMMDALSLKIHCVTAQGTAASMMERTGGVLPPSKSGVGSPREPPTCWADSSQMIKETTSSGFGNGPICQCLWCQLVFMPMLCMVPPKTTIFLYILYNVAASSLTQSHDLTKCAAHRQKVNNMLSGTAFKRSNRVYDAGMK